MNKIDLIQKWAGDKMISDVVVVDLGMSNVKSVVNMLRKVGVNAIPQELPTHIEERSLIIVPGVGTFDEGMQKMNLTGWDSALKDAFQSEKVKILGLCLGMQLLTEGSDEGKSSGLGIIPGYFEKFMVEADNPQLKIPHMGWNEVDFTPRMLHYINELPAGQRYYFVHSFKYVHKHDDHVAGYTNYGARFASAIANNNALGLQFHPEKSHRFGSELFTKLLAVHNA